ncbi:MAG: hypothetical protein K2Y39_04315 [Candidatus Obscuribacterales bacterium]|nr:hypothetical protein [Candidatus Obscuribacterales bacterium]
MNKLSLSVSIASLVTASVSMLLSAQPALADNHSRFAKDELQPATWFKARREIRVENTTPIVKYDIPPEPEPVYLIPTGLPKAKAAPVVVLPGPGQTGGAGGGMVAPPGYAVVDPSHPAPARFGSNIPAGGMAPARALPNGNTTNRLAGRMWGEPKSPVQTVSLPTRLMPVGDAAAKTASYPQLSSSAAATGAGTSSSTVKTAVKGDLLRK